VRLLPEDLAALTPDLLAMELPLFLVIFGGIGVVGVLIGFVWEWFREMRIAPPPARKSREVSRLERELAVLKDSTQLGPAEGRGSGAAGKARRH
jgi:putative membrane protein